MSSGNLPGVSVKDVDQQKFVKALAAFFKKAGKIKMIENADLIKLGSYKEMAPDDIDWFYTRTDLAFLCLKVAMLAFGYFFHKILSHVGVGFPCDLGIDLLLATLKTEIKGFLPTHAFVVLIASFVVVAAIARHLYIRSPVGVGALTYMYGGRQNNGTTPSHFVYGSASVARKALQALESLKMVEKDPNGGRKLTSTGRRDLDRIATQLKANKQ